MAEDKEDKGRTAPDEAVQRPSKEYEIAVNTFKEYHVNSTNYSGKFLRPHAKYIKSLIDEFDIESILDYGCGKGLQYEWRFPPGEVQQGGEMVTMPEGQTIEEYWGIEATKYDPCVPKFEKKPEGKYDLVVCTHVLGCIPLKDLRGWALDELFGYANKFVYIVEAIDRDSRGGKKRNLIDPAQIECAVGFSPIQWLDLIAPHKPADVNCELVCRYRSDAGTFTGRFRI